MTTRLSLYNDALIRVGERPLANLAEEREPRRILDQVYESDGVNKCLEMGQWHFAMRAVGVDYDPAIEPPFGYNRAFNKPDDWVLTSAVCSDEYFREPLLEYTDEAEQWYADYDLIYVRYVSNDSDYGTDLNKWPGSFEDYVASYFAYQIAPKLQGSDEAKQVKLLREMTRCLKVAKNKAAMALPTQLPARGSWTRSRQRNFARDRGNLSGNLY